MAHVFVFDHEGADGGLEVKLRTDGSIAITCNHSDVVLNGLEAVVVRDGLSRAIVEAAQASAKAKVAEPEGTPA